MLSMMLSKHVRVHVESVLLNSGRLRTISTSPWSCSQPCHRQNGNASRMSWCQKKTLQVRHSSVAVNFFVSFKLSRTNSNYLEWRAISPGQCAKTWADLSSGPQVNAACPRWIMVTQGFFLGAELSCFFCIFFCSGLGSLFFHCFSSSFHQFSNCFR